MYCMLQAVDSLQSSAQSLQVQSSNSQKKKCSMQFPNELMVHSNTWWTFLRIVGTNENDAES
jgi:hypothetical protein